MKTRKAVIISSKGNPLHMLTEELTKRGITTEIIFREDVFGIEKMKEQADRIGPVDYLFISSLTDRECEGVIFTEMSIEDYKQFRYYSLEQFYDINNAFVTKMADNGGGVVIGISSIASVVPSVNQSINGAAGAGLNMGIQCLAEESCEDGIYANAVAIGAVEDNDDIRTMTNDEEMIKHIPDKKLLDPREVVKKIADIALSTDRCFTGNIINIDAGFADSFMRDW